MIQEILSAYDWLAALVTLGATFVLTVALYKLIFTVPEFRKMRDLNREADKKKMSRERFRQWVKDNTRLGLRTNYGFWALLLPFCVSLASQPFWMHLVQLVLWLAIFDLLYYATHRWLFHGKLLRKVHALHHQAHTPTYIDGMYVHPLETFIGLALFWVSIPITIWLTGARLHAGSVVFGTLLFTQLNTLNHCWTNIGRSPYKVIDYITGVHASHHIDMNHGNYAVLSMVYDWIFRTYEKPTRRATA